MIFAFLRNFYLTCSARFGAKVLSPVSLHKLLPHLEPLKDVLLCEQKEIAHVSDRMCEPLSAKAVPRSCCGDVEIAFQMAKIS